MSQSDPANLRLNRLRQWRNPRRSDPSLGAFLPRQFKQEVERPYRQLASISAVWASLVPADLHAHTRLESLARGVLRVAVDSSARHFELDRLLRSGLEQRLITAHKGPAFRRVQLRIADASSWSRPAGPPPQRGDALDEALAPPEE